MSEESVGISLLLLSLVCLGTWPALLRLCSVPPTTAAADYHHPSAPSKRTSSPSSLPANHQENDNCPPRHLCHVYIDYATAYFVSSVLPLGVTLVYWNAEDSSWLGFRRIFTACCGGALLSAGNLSMQWAVTVFQAPLTTVLALQSSLTVVLGTSLNYLLQPDKTHHPLVLVWGVLVFLTAIGLASASQYSYQKFKESHMKNDSNVRPYKRHGSSLSGIEMEEKNNLGSSPYGTNIPVDHRQDEDNGNYKDDTDDSSDSVRSFQKDQLYNINGYVHSLTGNKSRTITSAQQSSTKVSAWQGISVALAGGVCFGFFSPAVNIAVNDPFQWQQPQPRQQDTDTATTAAAILRANMWFALSFWIASCVGNILLLQNEQQLSTSEVLHCYLYQDGFVVRRLALAAGLVCAAGNLLQFQGGQTLGYATADLVQAYPLVSTLWDVLVFGEFQHVRFPSKLFALLMGMYVAYLSGIVLLAASSMA